MHSNLCNPAGKCLQTGSICLPTVTDVGYLSWRSAECLPVGRAACTCHLEVVCMSPVLHKPYWRRLCFIVFCLYCKCRCQHLEAVSKDNWYLYNTQCSQCLIWKGNVSFSNEEVFSCSSTFWHSLYLMCVTYSATPVLHNMRKFKLRGVPQQNQNFKLISCFTIPTSQLRSQSGPAALVCFDLSMSYVHKCT